MPSSYFETVSEDDRGEERLLTGHSALTETARKRARVMASIGRVTRSVSVYFVGDSDREDVEGTAVIGRDELDDPDRLRELIRERSGREPA